MKSYTHIRVTDRLIVLAVGFMYFVRLNSLFKPKLLLYSIYLYTFTSVECWENHGILGLKILTRIKQNTVLNSNLQMKALEDNIK